MTILNGADHCICKEIQSCRADHSTCDHVKIVQIIAMCAKYCGSQPIYTHVTMLFYMYNIRQIKVNLKTESVCLNVSRSACKTPESSLHTVICMLEVNDLYC